MMRAQIARLRERGRASARLWRPLTNLPQGIGPIQGSLLLPEDEPNPPAGRGNLENGRFVPAAGAVATASLQGGPTGGSGDGMTVDLLRASERGITCTKERLATQDRRSGNLGRKRPGKGPKHNRGDAKRSLLGGEGPPAKRRCPSAATSDPNIARQGVTRGVRAGTLLACLLLRP